MKSSFRPTSVDDLGALRQFLQRVFNTSIDAPFLEVSVMKWKYWDRRDDWEGPRSYVLEREGVIVAHAGIWPVNLGEVRGVQMIDWASAKESPGAGLAVLQKLNNLFDFIYSIGGSEMTCKILPAFGFAECTKQWRGARPLRPLRQIATHQHRNWKLAPRLARNFLWSLPKAKDRLNEGWKSEEICPGEVSAGFCSQSMAETHFSPRSPGFFEYLLRCPVIRTRLYAIRDKDGPRGHFAVGVLRGQARVAGVWLSDPNLQAWQAAWSLAQKAAGRLEGACEIATAGSEGISEQAAVHAGLRIAGHTPVFLLNKKGKLSLPPDFQFQLSDDDAFFLDAGNSSYWT
jgi:hypothetical protein